jgi:YidC/Oxa1 family membrane protein insertase
MILMQRVQPEIKKIQQKYKDDRAKQNEELLKYYQENKINPLAGCLPLLLILPIGIAVLGTFRHPGIQAHIPRTGTFSKLYTDMCGNTSVSVCKANIAKSAPKALHFLGMDLNLSAANSVKDGFGHAFPYFILLGLVILSGWYQVRQTQARQAKSGGAAPNAQMQAVTKIMPIFFGVISYGFSAATTIYFLISNVWRIGQQHFVLNKMYEEEHPGEATKKPKPKPAIEASEEGGKPPPTPPPQPRRGGGTSSGASGGGTGNRPPANAARRKKKRKR